MHCATRSPSLDLMAHAVSHADCENAALDWGAHRVAPRRTHPPGSTSTTSDSAPSTAPAGSGGAGCGTVIDPRVLHALIQGTRRLQALTQVTELEDVPNVPRSSGEVSWPHTTALGSASNCVASLPNRSCPCQRCSLPRRGKGLILPSPLTSPTSSPLTLTRPPTTPPLQAQGTKRHLAPSPFTSPRAPPSLAYLPGRPLPLCRLRGPSGTWPRAP